MRIAILDDYQKVALKMADWSVLPAGTGVTVFNDNLAEDNAVVERLQFFEIVVAMRERTPFTRRRLECLPRLKLLVTTGPKNAAIDLDAATELGIVVSGTGALVNQTAELAWGLILALTRNIPQEDLATRNGCWQTTVGVGLHRKTLGILGLGKLGSSMARVGNAFGMSVIGWSQNLTRERASECGATWVTKEDLFARSDVLTIHLQLSERTRGLVGDRDLKMMKPTAYLVNTSRGPIVDEAALVEALRRHVIAGAGLDVFNREPLPHGHPLLGLRNVVLSPHMGYVTEESYRVYHRDCIEDIVTFIQGHPVRVINPAVLEGPGRLRS